MGRVGSRARATHLWTPGDRELLKEARRDHGHNQTECAIALTALGAGEIGQRTVSAWETGSTTCPSERNLDALRLYLLEVGHDLTADPATAAPAPPIATPTEPAVARSVTAEDTTMKQAVARRIASAVPMSEWDYKALERFTDEGAK